MVQNSKLIALMHISFDGFAATATGAMDWITHDQEIFEHVSKFIAKAEVGIYGPKTFQMMEGYWPDVLKDPSSSELELNHARWYQAATKIVCSQTVARLENSKAGIIKSNLAEEIQKLKQQSKGDLMVFGSPRLTQSLARLDLFDEYVVNVNPVLLGGGIRMFEDLPRTKLKTVSATTFSSGVVGFHYRKQN